MNIKSLEFSEMQPERGASSQSAQSLDTVNYLNEQIQKGARVTVSWRNNTSLGLDWPVTKVGTDFVALSTGSGKEVVVPRTHVSKFRVDKRAQNARP